MQSYTFSTEELYRDYECDYIVNILRELVEKERKEVSPEYKNTSDYKFVIGENISKVLHLSKTDHIFGFEVIYESSYVFEPNSVDFGIFKVDKKSCINCRYGVGDNSCCPHIHVCRKRSDNDIPSHWLEMTEAQKFEKSMSNVNGKRKLVGDFLSDWLEMMEGKKFEKSMSNINGKRKLVGDISNGYYYIDTDVASIINESNQIKYNEMYVKKEDKKMDIKLYECRTFTGGIATKPQDLIKNVIFSGPCTIVQWSDGDKTIVRCENEDFDKEKGLAMAIVKKLFGTNESKSNYNDIFKKWIPEEEVEEQLLGKEDDITEILTAKQLAEKMRLSVSTVLRDCRRGIHPGAMKVDGKWLIPFKGLKKEDSNE